MRLYESFKKNLKETEDVDYKQKFIDYCKGKVKDLGTVKIKGADAVGYTYIDDENENKAYDIRVDCVFSSGYKALNPEDTLEAFGLENSYLQGKNFVDGGEMDPGHLYSVAELDFKYIDTNFYKELLDNWESWEMPMWCEEAQADNLNEADKSSGVRHYKLFGDDVILDIPNKKMVINGKEFTFERMDEFVKMAKNVNRMHKPMALLLYTDYKNGKLKNWDSNLKETD